MHNQNSSDLQANQMTQFQHGKNADAFLLSSQANQMADMDNQYVSSLIDQVD
jgi:hypothetical protein